MKPTGLFLHTVGETCEGRVGFLVENEVPYAAHQGQFVECGQFTTDSDVPRTAGSNENTHVMIVVKV